jgi:phage protein U
MATAVFKQAKGRLIGALGDVVFTVSSKAIQTIEKLELKKSVEFGTHKLHNGKTLLEYTGRNPATGSFPITLSAFLGVNPLKVLKVLEKHLEKGQVLSFTLGTKKIGKKWVITDVQENYTYFDVNGDVLAIDVTVSIKEYN